jgi:hypothetical protein
MGAPKPKRNAKHKNALERLFPTILDSSLTRLADSMAAACQAFTPYTGSTTRPLNASRRGELRAAPHLVHARFTDPPLENRGKSPRATPASTWKAPAAKPEP